MAAPDASQEPQGTPAPVTDKSKYIRTYAKDLAALSGGAAPQSTRPTPAPPPPPKAPEPVQPKEEVVLPESERPFFEKPQPKPEPAPETVELPTLAEASSIVGPAPAPVPQPAPGTPDKEREAILERLRQKVSESAQMSVDTQPAPEPAPPPALAKEWQNIPAPAPVFSPLPEETTPVDRIPPVRRDPPPAPAPEPAPERLHTYTSDFANQIDEKKASTFSVLAAQQDAAVRTPQTVIQSAPRKNPLPAILTGALVLVLAAGGIFATYWFVMKSPSVPIAQLTVPSLVFADEYKEISGEGSSLMAALAQASEEALVPGNVLVTYITESGEDEKGTMFSRPAAGGALIRALELPAPDIFLRNVAEESTVGVINANDDTRPFFVFRVNSYERTFAGMLTWEPLMYRDLNTLYPLHPIPAAPPVPEVVATTTASTTPMATTTPQPTQPHVQAQPLTRFADDVVANRDVRVLRDTSGKTLLLYGYADKATLIVARDEVAFAALIDRLIVR